MVVVEKNIPEELGFLRMSASLLCNLIAYYCMVYEDEIIDEKMNYCNQFIIVRVSFLF